MAHFDVNLESSIGKQKECEFSIVNAHKALKEILENNKS